MLRASPAICFEELYDANKIRNPELNFFSLSSERIRTSIQARNFQMADILPPGISVPSPGTYFLEIKLGSHLTEGKTWQIRDHESGFSYPVSAGMLFPFTVYPDILESLVRFTLIGQTPALSTKEKQSAARLLLFPNPGKEIFHIHGLEGEASFRIESPDGKIISEGITAGQLQASGLAPGWYIVRVKDKRGDSSTMEMAILEKY